MSRTTAFSERFDQALILASLAHDGVPRKGTVFPYIMHPVHVASVLERHGFSEHVAIAGLLHDVLEDAKFGAPALQNTLRRTFTEFESAEATEAAFRAATEAFIESRFGREVPDLVLAVTEAKTEGNEKRPWRVRKDEQIAHISQMNRGAAALKAADALHNSRSVLRDVQRDGIETLRRFNCSIEETLWHYGTVVDALRDVLTGHPLHKELDDAVFELTEEMSRLLRPDVAIDRCLFCGRSHEPDGQCSDSADTAPVLMNGSGQRIRSLAHWFRLAPPVGRERQWVKGLSAREVARAWSGLVAAPDIVDAVRRTDGLTDFRVSTVIAELVTPLDEFGEGRNHDLVLLGVAGGRRVLVGIEAKNDEELGPQIGPYLERTNRENEVRRQENKSRLSQVPSRIANLSRMILVEPPAGLNELRYQLLHGLGGTLIEAARRRAQVGVFLVHVFASGSTDIAKAERNEEDIMRFADVLQPAGREHLLASRLLGPISANGDSVVPHAFPFYFGIARTACAAEIPLVATSTTDLDLVV
jgi:hypothetical protein